MKQKSGYEKKLHYLTKGLLIAFVAILVVCYIPKIRFYRNELPNLEFYSENENADEFVKLPDEFEKEQILCFWTNHQNVKVYLNDQEIYNTNGDGRELFVSEAPSRWNRIKIPEDSAGKELRIHSDTQRYPVIREYVYGTDEEINQWLHQYYGSTQLADAGIVWIGMVFVLFGFFSKRKSCNMGRVYIRTSRIGVLE